MNSLSLTVSRSDLPLLEMLLFTYESYYRPCVNSITVNVEGTDDEYSYICIINGDRYLFVTDD